MYRDNPDYHDTLLLISITNSGGKTHDGIKI
jgi:hypothetical protein